MTAGREEAAQPLPPVDECRAHSGDREAGRIQPSRWRLRRGELLRLQVGQDEEDVEVLVCGPDGEAILGVDALNGTEGPEDVPILALRSGTYRLLARGGEKKGVHPARVLVRRAARPVDRERFRAARASWQARESSDPRRRLALLAGAAKSWARVADLRGAADSSLLWGLALAESSRSVQAERVLSQAGRLYLHLQDGTGWLSAFQHLARMQERLGDSGAARKIYERALRGATAPPLRLARSTALLELGILRTRGGDPEGALSVLHEALSIREPLGEKSRVAEVLNGLGRAYLKAGEAGRALDCHGRALGLLRRDSDRSLVAQTLHHLGDAFAAAGDGLRAASRYEWALKIWSKLGEPPEEATTLNNLAQVYYRSRDYPSALRTLNRALMLYERSRDAAASAQALVNAAWVSVDLGQPNQALRLLDEAARRAGRVPGAPLAAGLHLGRARALLFLRDFDGAIRESQPSLEMVEGMRRRIEDAELRTSFAAGVQTYFEIAIEARMEKHRLDPQGGWAEQALVLSEWARARSLYDTLEGGPAQPEILADEIQKDLLDDESILLEIFLGERRGYLWAVTRKEIRTVDLPGRATLGSLARKVVRELASSDTAPSLDGAYASALALSRALLGKLGRLPAEKRLVFVVPPELHSVPLAALPDPFVRPGAVGSGWPSPLIQRKTLVVEPSMAVLARLRQRRRAAPPAGEGIAAFAAPKLQPSDGSSFAGLVCRDGEARIPLGPLGPLPFGESEARALAAIVGEDRIRMFLGEEASVDTVRSLDLTRFGYLYFSGHGYVDTKDAYRSAIVLSAFDGADRPLEPCLFARDIAALRLSADLVMVSTCGSGLGRVLRGEGVLGLGQAFLSAGAARVGMTLWDVQERPTAAFMEAFHRRMLRNGRDPVEALREAQLEIRRHPGWAGPAFWGGFVLFGDWE